MEVCLVKPDYTWNTKIATYDVGQDVRLKLSSQLKLQQEVGELHLQSAGLDYQELYRQGMVFVLTRTNSVIYRAPILNETINLCTWHRDRKGAQFYRCYRFKDKEGTTLIDSVSAFALIDAKTHRLLRPDRFNQFGIKTQPERKNSCPDPSRIKISCTINPVEERLIHWSDTDYNGHLNNTNYADIVCDNIPGGMRGKRITSFTIAYQQEALEGQKLGIQAGTKESSDGICSWVIGRRENAPCFEAKVGYVLEQDEQ
jgi:acyl-ACP thioesterase